MSLKKEVLNWDVFSWLRTRHEIELKNEPEKNQKRKK